MTRSVNRHHAASGPDSPEIPHILSSSAVRYNSHNRPALDAVLSQINALRVITTYFLNIHFIIIPFPTTTHKRFLLFRFSDNNFARAVSHLSLFIN